MILILAKQEQKFDEQTVLKAKLVERVRLTMSERDGGGLMMEDAPLKGFPKAKRISISMPDYEGAWELYMLLTNLLWASQKEGGG